MLVPWLLEVSILVFTDVSFEYPTWKHIAFWLYHGEKDGWIQKRRFFNTTANYKRKPAEESFSPLCKFIITTVYGKCFCFLYDNIILANAS